MLERYKCPTDKSTYPRGGVWCSKESFVVNQTLLFQIKFCVKVQLFGLLQTVQQNNNKKRQLIGWRSAFQYTYFEHRSDFRTSVIFNSWASSVISSLTSTSIRFTLELNSEPALNRITFRFTFNKKSELVQPFSITFSIFLRFKKCPRFPESIRTFYNKSIFFWFFEEPPYPFPKHAHTKTHAGTYDGQNHGFYYIHGIYSR